MMKLGCFVDGSGHHTAAWRDPDVDPHGRQTLAQYANIARTAERGKFDLLFMADTNATFGADDVETWTRTTLAAVAGRRRARSLVIVISATRTW